MKLDNTFSLISKIYTAVNELLIKELRANNIEGIVPSHGSILWALLEENDLSMNELAFRIGKSPQTVTTLVQKLITFGYVQTRKSDKDKRTTIVQLTGKGASLSPIINSISEKIYRKQYEGMSSEEVDIFRKLLTRMKENFCE